MVNNKVLRIKARQSGQRERERRRDRRTDADMRLDNVVRYPCNVSRARQSGRGVLGTSLNWLTATVTARQDNTGKRTGITKTHSTKNICRCCRQL